MPARARSTLPCFLGVDVGSVSTNVVLADGQGRVIGSAYLRTQGDPIAALQAGLREVRPACRGYSIRGVGATGSARELAARVVGADIVKNEITAHAVAALAAEPSVRTVIEIGGQDSKLILFQDGVVADFAMNTVCAAGTGSFLDQQAERLGVPVERLGDLALRSKNPARIAGRCAVFAESDMIHKQQVGYAVEDLVAGLCDALVRNYLAHVAKGKDLSPPVLLQGGVAANTGIRRAFETALGTAVCVPEHFNVMGAWGAALLARDRAAGVPTSSTSPTGPLRSTRFRGWAVSDRAFETRSFVCTDCTERCEVMELRMDEEPVARWSDRCGRWGSPSSPRRDR